MGCVNSKRARRDPEASHYAYWLGNERTPAEQGAVVREVAAKLAREGDAELADEVLANQRWRLPRGEGGREGGTTFTNKLITQTSLKTSTQCFNTRPPFRSVVISFSWVKVELNKI